MDSAISEAIDRSLGDAPPEPALEEIIERGRRRQRMRRLVASGSVVAVTVVGGVAASAVAGGATDHRTPPVSAISSATPPTRSPSPTSEVPRYTGPGAPITTRTRTEGNSGVSPDNLVDYGLDGTVYVYPGARLTRWIDNPYGLAPPERSDAVAVEFHGTTYFFVLVRSSDGSSANNRIARGPWCPALTDWVQRQSGLTAQGH